MYITGTCFSYYYVCHRKLWLFASGIQMEQTSELVSTGKLVHETSYPQRSERYTELSIDGIKIDYYDSNQRIVHEIKKSKKIEEAHVWQLKYYLFVLEENGIDGVSGVLEYPLLRQTTEVFLDDGDRAHIASIREEIEKIIQGEVCPPMIHSRICLNCSYQDFCYSGEEI
ncbi:CRISPR-associated protein Cas4 [Porphyromonas levii]|uniref:CRISPR-associated exonuclease Cas4 n=1 Tax=Porphyromonas levii TaxID=28114 RepID=A0A4Y8WNK8_9PORP|nr:CRISPR-associated protein Cas4 [Porphyromonas levii]TFH94413.1 CRISPR-associated protein Cas4 [Porphyromonas levii]TFH95106.1 CRISPR-associated protein Cas4 [Porphyromonas levii]